MGLNPLAANPGLASHIKNTSTCGSKNSISCNRISLHRPAEARVEVGFTFCNEAKLERRSNHLEPLLLNARYPSVTSFDSMRAASNKDYTLFGQVTHHDLNPRNDLAALKETNMRS